MKRMFGEDQEDMGIVRHMAESVGGCCYYHEEEEETVTLLTTFP